MQWGGTDVYTSIAITQITAQNISNTPCVSFQTNPFSQKGNHYSSTSHCDKFIAFVPALVSRNKILWPLAHLWWFHVPLEFESTFFWSFILKTCNFSLSLLSLSCYQGRKIFLTPFYIVTRCGSPWLDETPPGSVSRQKGDEDQNLSHGMLSSSAWQKQDKQLLRLSRKRRIWVWGDKEDDVWSSPLIFVGWRHHHLEKRDLRPEVWATHLMPVENI